MKVLVIQPTTSRDPEFIRDEEKRIAKSLKENGFILLSDFYYNYSVVEIDDVRVFSKEVG